jgi:hypothetical protein
MILNGENTMVSRTGSTTLAVGMDFHLCAVEGFHTARVPTSGSFIRPSGNIIYGTSFLEGLHSKYIEDTHGSQSQEKVLLGSSHGAIEVEAVRLDKIRGKFADLQRLREVGLDNVARDNAPGEIRSTCPSESIQRRAVPFSQCYADIRGLDLSSSLLPSWDIVASITAELSSLQRLVLK